MAKLAALSVTARSCQARARRRCRRSRGMGSFMAAPLSTSGPPRRGSPHAGRCATAARAWAITPPRRGRAGKTRSMAGDAMTRADGAGAPARPRGRADAGLSIVVPLFNEANNLATLHARIVEVARALKAERALATEAVYVDDGSHDATLSAARELPAESLDIQVISLSRNFGKEAALLAGLDHARLGAVLFMDGDGQHPPALVQKLVGYWLDDGYDVVYTAKAHRASEPWLRRLGVKVFYALINWGARQKIPEDAGDFRLLSPRAAAALKQLPERNRFFKGLASWIGFRQIRVDYEPAERIHGRTTWNLYSLIGLSIEGLTSFSVAPLRLASLLGLLLAAPAIRSGVSNLSPPRPLWPSRPGGCSTSGGILASGSPPPPMSSRSSAAR